MKKWFLLCVGTAFLAANTGSALAATYTWQGGSGTNWSTDSNWGSTTDYPGDGGSATTDTATVNGTTTGTTTIVYDGGTSGYVGTLNLTQSSGVSASAGNIYLELQNNLTINNGGTLLSTTGNGSTTGIIQIQLGNSNLNIASGATLILGSATVAPISNATGTPITNALTGTTTSTGTGGITINGTLEQVIGNTAAGNGFTQNINAPVTLSSTGTINIVDNDATANSNRLIMASNFTTVSGSKIEATGTVSADANLFFSGASTTIAAGTTITGFATGSGIFTMIDSGTSTTAQSISLGVLLPGLQIRNANAVGTSGNSLTITKTISSSATSGSIANAVDQVGFNNSKGFTNLVLALGSNLNLATGNSSAFSFTMSNTAGLSETVDLAGFMYNATTSTNTVYAPSGTTAGNTSLQFVNSGASSITNKNGIFEAGGFNLSGADAGVGSGVILQAVTTGTTNNLGVQASGTTTVSANSTFYYTGAGTATLTSNRSIGQLVVGSGSTASVLQAASTLTSAAGITVNTGATLDLNGNNVTESSGSAATTGGLNGSGTVLNSVIATPNTLTLDTTRGNGSFSGVIEDHASSGGTVAVAIGGTGTQTFSGASTYSGGTSLTSGSLLLSNTAGSATGTGALTVSAGAILGGYGSSSGTGFSVGGTGSRTTLLVGMNSTSDTNTTHSLTLVGSGSNSITNTTLQFNISAVTLGQGTELNVGSSAVTIGNSTLALNVQGTGVIPAYSSYVLIAGTGTNQYSGLGTSEESIGGQMYDVITSGLSLSFAPSQANAWYADNSFLYLNTAGGVDDIDVAVVPEPSTWALMFGGLVALAFWQRQRARRS